MSENYQLLLADIAADESQIAQIFEKLSAFTGKSADTEETIVIGYYLHNLYSAFEHISSLIASAFENNIDDRSQWHSLLLRRMAQPIEGIRPALFRAETYSCLDELRAFRHVFRSAYTATLDPERVELVLRKARELQVLYPDDMERFKKFLREL